MKKLIILSALIIVTMLPVSIFAQDTTLPAPVTEENTLPELPIGEETPNESDNKTPQVNEETQQSFVNGIIAGAVAGLLVGGVFTWFLKDKII